jgi:hypothetical protein
MSPKTWAQRKVLAHFIGDYMPQIRAWIEWLCAVPGRKRGAAAIFLGCAAALRVLGYAPWADALVGVNDFVQHTVAPGMDIIGGLFALWGFIHNAQRGAKVAGAILLVLLLPAAARADQAPPVTVTVAAGAELAMSSAGSKPTPSAHVEVAGPLALGAGAARGGVWASLDVLGLPGETEAPALADLSTWAALRAHGGLSWRLGALDQAGQHVETRGVAFGGFANRFGTDPAPAARTARDYGAGIEFAETTSGTRVRIAYGHDDAVGPEFGRGHLLVAGYVPVSGTHGVVLVGAEAALAIGHPAGITSTDRVSVRVLFSLPRSGTQAAPAAPASSLKDWQGGAPTPDPIARDRFGAPAPLSIR